MEETAFQEMAAQLRKPEGEMGIRTAEKMNSGNALINRFTIDLLHAAPSAKILEIGMGNGQFVKEIFATEPSITYTGCDYSADMVQEAGRRNASLVEAGKAFFHLANADSLPFPEQSFDIIFTVNTIYFWEDPVRTLTEIKRVLAPAGRLLISVRPRQVMETYPFTRFGFTMYDKQELRELLEQNSWNITQVLEKDEPFQEVNGNQVLVSSLIISASVNTLHCP